MILLTGFLLGVITNGHKVAAQPAEGTADTKPSENKPADAESADAEPADAEPADAEPADAESADAESADAESAEAADGEQNPFTESVKPAAKKEPLFKASPFDRITVKEGDEEILVLPIDLPDRRVPEEFPRTGSLRVRLVEKPTQLYEIRWRDIARIDLFENMILQEAQSIVAAGRYDEAFIWFSFLRRNYPSLPGLQEATARYLYEDAKSWQRKEKYESAVALLLELHNVDPDFAELPRALSLASGKLIEARMQDNDYLGARQLLKQLTDRFPDTEVGRHWRDQLVAIARESHAEATSALADNHLTEAHEACRRTLEIWPILPGARELYQQVHEQYPRLIVGVTRRYGGVPEHRLLDDGARRVGRLLNRPLVELTGFGVEGGQYACPLGSMEIADLGLRLSFQLRGDIFWSPSGARLSGHDVASTLRAMATPSDIRFQRDWAELLASVDVTDVTRVEVQLTHPHVRPEGLLQSNLLPWNAIGDESSPDASQPTLGDYALLESNPREQRFVARQPTDASAGEQPREVVERYFARGGPALSALREGKIVLIDRLNPWDVDKAREDEQLVVGRYGIPTVHCLLFNPHQPLFKYATFRRALVYGLHREAILRRQLLRGQEENHGQVLSGPFPRGYAYDAEIIPRPYEPRLAMTLAQFAVDQLAAEVANATPPDSSSEAAAESAAASADSASEPSDGTDQPAESEERTSATAPELVLAHPPHELARIACQSIQRQLKLIGIPIKLQELEPGASVASLENYDLLYAELALADPIVDAMALLGSGGLARYDSPYMDLALRQLEAQSDWRAAREQLLLIHRMAHDSVPLVPLWQLTDHFAHRRNLTGLGDAPVQLYQNVQQWRSPLMLPPDVN